MRGYSFICVGIGKEEDPPTSTALSQPPVCTIQLLPTLLTGYRYLFQPNLATEFVKALRGPRAEGAAFLTVSCKKGLRELRTPPRGASETHPWRLWVETPDQLLSGSEHMEPLPPSSVCDRQGRMAGTLIRGLCASALGPQQPGSTPPLLPTAVGSPVSELPRTCPLGSSGSFWH